MLLKAEFEGAPVGLAIYMAAQLMSAMQDLYKLTPQPEPDPRMLFQRFVAWTAREPLA
ncbi:hypothetical protein [Plantactinospora sp. B5E13]|uniref:hypothetical protein n=1 Tax=Plantactinospora sp. B5E13 TaxID=3153758 RepID=UPI00325D1E4B